MFSYPLATGEYSAYCWSSQENALPPAPMARSTSCKLRSIRGRAISSI